MSERITFDLASFSRARKIPVAVLGATGTVGQRFVSLLEEHPWFEVQAVAASERSEGKSYGEAVTWIQTRPLSPRLAAMAVQPCRPSLVPADGEEAIRLVFSALDASVAGEIETSFAEAGHLVVSNARNHRMEPDVPLLVPEVNPEHLVLAERQAVRPGAILTNPNCSTIGLVLALKPLADAFGIERLHVVTLQAISGAGLPGVSSYHMTDNVLPFISGEEAKMQSETRKILGRLTGGEVEPASLVVSAQCNRVPVVDGHLLCVSAALGRRADLEEVRAAWTEFRALPQQLGLPSAPLRPIHYLSDPAAPQPRLHRDLDGGMAVVVGRLQECPTADIRFVALSHNTIRGAAGGSLLVGELATARGLVPGVTAVDAAALS